MSRINYNNRAAKHSASPYYQYGGGPVSLKHYKINYTQI